jgi:hypothetical protein
MTEEKDKKIINWNDRLEEYFASTGEKCHCLSWLHKKSEAVYSLRTTFIDLPVIVISTVVGAASIGSDSLFGDSPLAPVILGIFSIFVSVLNTVGSYFAWSRRAEAHRVSSIQYAKMYRYLNVEMSLPRLERSTPPELLKYVRDEYERLSEISPLLPPKVIAEFNARFHHLKEISQPEEVNGLEKITVYIPKLETMATNTDPEEPPPPPPEPEIEDTASLDGGVVIPPEEPLPELAADLVIPDMEEIKRKSLKSMTRPWK